MIYMVVVLLFFRPTDVPRQPRTCLFGPPISHTFATNSFLKRAEVTNVTSWRDITTKFFDNYNPEEATGEEAAIFNFLNMSINPLYQSTAYERDGDPGHFAIRTCNSFWNPQVTVAETNVDPFFLGMSSQATEREDTIITPDLRGQVFGGFDYNRRDLMAVNMQRARDHGLPDYNSARVAYGLPPVEAFEDINELYGIDDIVTDNIENLRDVYNNDINKCDIWACGMAETLASDRDFELSGPGELFTEVLFDQFMRIRHGDRFWYENYRFNGYVCEGYVEHYYRVLLIFMPASILTFACLVFPSDCSTMTNTKLSLVLQSGTS